MITKGLENVTAVNVTDSAELTCSAVGVPVPVIVWLRVFPNGSAYVISEVSAEITTEVSENELISLLELANTTTEDSGVYVCSSSNNVSINGTLSEDTSATTLVVQGELIIATCPVLTITVRVPLLSVCMPDRSFLSAAQLLLK